MSATYTQRRQHHDYNLLRRPGVPLAISFIGRKRSSAGLLLFKHDLGQQIDMARTLEISTEPTAPQLEDTECINSERNLQKECDLATQPEQVNKFLETTERDKSSHMNYGLITQQKQLRHESLSINSTQTECERQHSDNFGKKFRVGDKVLLQYSRIITCDDGKYAPKLKGPYTVRKISRKHTPMYYLNGITEAVNANKLEQVRTDKANTFPDLIAQENVHRDRSDKPKRLRRLKRPSDTLVAHNRSDLPIKRRKLADSNTWSVLEGSSKFLFRPVDETWQNAVAFIFKENVENSYKTGPERYISRRTRPTHTVEIKGDGNCLFRTFSYLVFGTQNHHSLVRHVLISFMKKNKRLMRRATNSSVDQYLRNSQMERDHIWGTEVEIFAFATLTQTTVYVYSVYGSVYRWLEYKPLSGERNTEKAIFIKNARAHFVPVLDVENEQCSQAECISRINN